MGRIELLDCTLRDGAYIVDGNFGETQISGIIAELNRARIDVIECGWLKNSLHEDGSTYYHLPEDIRRYVKDNKVKSLAVMIDYNRYDDTVLPCNVDSIIDIVRIVFPKGKVDEAIDIGERIRQKGYRIYFQMANTPGYQDEELLYAIKQINLFNPETVSIVDTFGTMDQLNLERILSIFEYNLNRRIKIGFHSHNNQQMSFALSVQFVEWLLSHSKRDLVVDSSLMGMGRGAGNTCTELIAHYLNQRHFANFDINRIMDCIDLYVANFAENNRWGYSVQYALAGIYGCHVNNVAYLNDVHRIKCKDMKLVFERMEKENRTGYNYEELEAKYCECISCEVDDKNALERLRQLLEGKKVVLILPGSTSEEKYEEVQQYIDKDTFTIGVNSVLNNYKYNLFFFTNEKKYDYYYNNIYEKDIPIMITSNVPLKMNEMVINYFDVIKGEWKYRDNSTLMLLRILQRLGVDNIGIVGFDGYNSGGMRYAEDTLVPSVSNQNELCLMQSDIEEMIIDFCNSYIGKLRFLTESCYESCIDRINDC